MADRAKRAAVGPILRACQCGAIERAFLALALAIPLLMPGLARAEDESWKLDWETKPGFSLSVDTEGYTFPSAIAFVRNPGSGPNDPIYFVTELRGTIKVVTNDRTVHTFAEDFFELEPMQPLSESPRLPEVGMAGIALDPEHGYVFVSFSYHDEQGRIRNNVMRFESEPETFSLKPKGRRAFTEIFSDQPGDDSHMIGPLAVHQNHLYVNVGDARIPSLSQDIHSTDGKILRMTLDGDPIEDNPFYVDGDRKKPANYVWAYGLRNPFGLKFAEGRVFVSDVGPGVDRFLRAEKGRNYYYDGSDWSIASHAEIVFTPSVSPVQLEHHPRDTGPFPEAYRGKLFVATTGHQGHPGPSEHGDKAILIIDYDFEDDRVVGRPRHLLKYRGNRGVMPVSIAFAPDGLYVALLSAERGRKHRVLRISYDPEHPHPYAIGRAEELMQTYGCTGCHRDDPRLPFPSLDRERLLPRLGKRLFSAEYIEESLRLDGVNEEPMKSYREARRLVREAEGIERIQLWLRFRLMEPRFDSPTAAMPNLGLSNEDATAIAGYLSGRAEDESPFQPIKNLIADWIPKPRQRHLFMFLAIGVALGASSTVVLVQLVAWGKRSRRAERRDGARDA